MKNYMPISINLKKSLLFIILISLITINGYSQSRYLENGNNGSSFEAKTGFDESGFISAGLAAAYSISGIMDFGFQLDRNIVKEATSESTEWSFDFLYNIIVLKQTEYVPLSLQLGITYGYSNVPSDYQDDPDLTREGQGFTVEASLFHEFNSRGVVSFLIGATGSYTNYLFTISDYSDTSDVTTEYDREENFLWGGIAAISLKPKNSPYFTIEVEVLSNDSADEIYVKPSFLIISPKY
jgi:hypothetical protein